MDPIRQVIERLARLCAWYPEVPAILVTQEEYDALKLQHGKWLFNKEGQPQFRGALLFVAPPGIDPDHWAEVTLKNPGNLFESIQSSPHGWLD